MLLGLNDQDVNNIADWFDYESPVDPVKDILGLTDEDADNLADWLNYEEENIDRYINVNNITNQNRRNFNGNGGSYGNDGISRNVNVNDNNLERMRNVSEEKSNQRNSLGAPVMVQSEHRNRHEATLQRTIFRSPYNNSYATYYVCKYLLFCVYSVHMFYL